MVAGPVALSSDPEAFSSTRMNCVDQGLVGMGQAPSRYSDLCLFRTARATTELFQIFHEFFRILQLFWGEVLKH